MANVAESGHVVNSNNINGRINVIDRHKTEYKPTNPAIVPEALPPLGESVKRAVESVLSAHLAFKKATANRRAEYEELDSRATRSINILKSSEATPAEIKLGTDLLKKYKSVRVGDVPDETELKVKSAANGEVPPIVKRISVSQQGYTNRLGHFTEITFFLKTVTAYKPNEEDLKVESMEDFADSIQVLNNKRNEAADVWSTAIIERNKIMYAKETGAYVLMTKIMDYVAGSSGKKSAFYLELQKYPVRNIKH